MDKEKCSKANGLYAKYCGLAADIALKILNNTDLVEDAVQITFEKIIHNLDKIGDIDSGATKNYIATVCRNCCVDMVRANKKDNENLEPNGEIENIADRKPLLEELVLTKEMLNFVKNILMEMDKKYSDVLILTLYHNHTVKETADILRISEAAVYKRYERGRKIIAEKLKEADYGK